MSAMVFYNCRRFLEQTGTIVRVCDGIPVSFTIVTNFSCTNATNVKYLQLSQFFTTFVTA